MECNCCGKEKEVLHKFYYGFFKTDYEPEKWCEICEDCQMRFIKACNGSGRDKMPLREMEADIVSKRSR